MDGGSSGSPGLGGGGGPFVDLPAIIWSAVEASIMASMQGVAAIITAAVEECLADDDRGRGLPQSWDCASATSTALRGTKASPPSDGR